MKDHLQKFLRTDIDYLTKSGFWLTSAQGIVFLFNILLTYIFANYLSQEMYGQYRYVIAFSLVIAAFSLTGIGISLIQTVARGYEGLFKIGVRLSYKWNFLVLLISAVISAYYYYNENNFLAISFLVIALSVPTINSFGVYQGFLAGKREFRLNSTLQIIRRGISSVVLIATIILSDNLLLLVCAFFATEVITQFTCYQYVNTKFSPNTKQEDGTIQFSKHLSLMNLFKTIGSHFDKILIFQFAGPAQLAVYAFALAPVSELSTLNKTIASAALPKFSNIPYDELQRTLLRKVFILSFAMSFLAAAYCYSAPLIYSLLFPAYTDAIAYSQALSILLVLAPGILISKAFVAHRKTKYLYFLRTFIPALKIVCTAALLPFFGLWGVVFATIVAQLSWIGLLIFLFLRKKNI